MKGTKTSLFLIELMIALLLFAFCAAICVQMFHASNKRTSSAEDLSKAVFKATTAAETYKSVGGDFDAFTATFGGNNTSKSGSDLTIYYDKDWNETLNPLLRATFLDQGYTLKISDNGNNSAKITVSKIIDKFEDNVILTVHDDIFEITVKAVA